MKIDIFTLFPGMFTPLEESMIGRAREKGLLEIGITNIRDYSENKHACADDYPFGGGAGMVMMAQPIFSAFDACYEQRPYTVFMSPRGRVLDQAKLRELSKHPRLAVICGHYEGVDQRVIDCLVDEEISIGDYVLTGGELPAMVMIDGLARYLEGVLGSSESAMDESFSDSLLEYPQYTRPAEFRGMKVPEVLLSGHHEHIHRWRREQKLLLTAQRRPDLLERAELSPKDLEFLAEMAKNQENQ